ncbi:MAG: exosortase-associated EpsI family protein [Planctomycetota bacterium]|nr:MAG: exosortase-associated EpsI family protein [Planctomycetota bacterium]
MNVPESPEPIAAEAPRPNNSRGRVRIVLFAATAVLLIAAGALERRWSGRSAAANDDTLLRFAAAVESVPPIVGSWHGRRGPKPSNPKILEATGALGWFSAEFTETITGDEVSVFWIAGRSRSISIHTPDACYPGAGFVMESEPQAYRVEYTAETNGRIEKRSADFKTAVFVKSEPMGTTRLRVFWAWNDGTGWTSPGFPRMKYGAVRPLTKLYLIAPSPPGELPHQSTALELADDLLPVLDAKLREAVEASSPPPSGVGSTSDRL